MSDHCWCGDPHKEKDHKKMVMNLKQAIGQKQKSPVHRKIEVVVRITNPRTKAVVEFGVPTTQDGFDENIQQQTFQTLANIFEQWGFEPPYVSDKLEQTLLAKLKAEDEANAAAQTPAPDHQPVSEEQTPVPDPQSEPVPSPDGNPA